MEVGDLVHHVVETLELLEIPYAIGGSLASAAYGEPRSTRDIDVVAGLNPEDVVRLTPHFPDPDFYLDARAARVAVAKGRMFNILHLGSGLKVDIFPSTDPVARSQLERAVRIRMEEGLEPRFSPPEELILKKMVYYKEGGSDRHLRDIMGMLLVSSDRIDREFVSRWAITLGLNEIWSAVLEREAGS